MKLVIVESPAKTKKIESFLGSGWVAKASFGHFRDLPEDRLGVEVGSDVKMDYVIHKRDVVSGLKGLAEKAEMVYLCTDPDREGEAISWHLREALRLRPGAFKRAVFHEITAEAVRKAVESPRDIDLHLVDAQQARRAIDRLFGYLVSQKLWALNFKRAGRVQSPALWILVDIERRIRAFVPRNFWTVRANYLKDGRAFSAELVEKIGEKYVRKEFAAAEEAGAAANAAVGLHKVVLADKKRVLKNPYPPFTTSTLQQFAGSHLKMNPGETMKIAQQLYEGGFITYMRTDSVTLSKEAQEMARRVITKINPGLLPDTAPVYKNKGSAQEAHEAIRPTHEDDSGHLQGSALALYRMIRERFLASQCVPAEYDQTTVVLKKDALFFKANGSVMVKPGFEMICQIDEEKPDDEEAEEKLPPISVDDLLNCPRAEEKKGTTKPPARLTQSQLTKKLEHEGIGRPSTYANIVEVLLKEYVEMDKKRKMVPTEQGMRVIEALETGFADYIKLDYTRQLEDQLDEVAAGKTAWKQFIREYSKQLDGALSKAPELLKVFVERAKVEAAGIPTGEACPNCGKPMVIRNGKNGKFSACTGYPECKTTKNIEAAAEGEAQKPKISRTACPKCKGQLEEKTGRYGKYFHCLGCQQNISSDDLKRVKAALKAEKAGIVCPKCAGSMVERTGRNGKFYGCARYPECNGIVSIK